MIVDIYTGSRPASSIPGDLTNVNGTLYFEADDGVHGNELWKSDGTDAGTTMVKDIFPGGALRYSGSFPGTPDECERMLYFVAFGPRRCGAVEERRHGRRDPMVKDIDPGKQVYARRFPDQRPHERERHAVLLGQRRPPTATSCGRATAPPTAPSWSRTSTPAAAARIRRNLTNVNGTLFFAANDGVQATSCGRATALPPAPSWSSDINPGGSIPSPTKPDERQRHALLLGQRRHTRRRSCGRAMARPPALSWSRTSTPAARLLDPSDLTNVERHAILRGQRRHHTAASCGRATAPPPAPSWSRTSTRARQLRPQRPDKRQRDAVFLGQRRHTRL